jgi:hypothetical protein
MRRIDHLEPEFVEEIPRTLELGRLYISIPYRTVTHLCCCGCGSEVVTSLHPRRWALTFDGETVSLSPSVGNWSLPCRSHYVITRNRVRWAESWSPGADRRGPRARPHGPRRILRKGRPGGRD